MSTADTSGGPGKRHGMIHRLYHGDTTFRLIHERKKFYAISIVLVLISLLSMGIKGFNLGVEFKGGTTFQVPDKIGLSVEEARDFVEGLGIADPIVQTVKTSSGNSNIRVETTPLTNDEVNQLADDLAKEFKVSSDDVTSQTVGASWGKEVSKKALLGLFIFMIAVIIYIALRFEPKMAAAAIIALIHDLILAAGVYSLLNFVVTPSTLIALLTVLGYSLYDTIVVFDKVSENTKGLEKQSNQTYAEAAELAVNQTFMRSINTSLIALLPVSGLLFVGALLLGAGTLKDLALALFVGLASGAYSSLFLATPLLADLKEREPRFQALHQRVIERRASGKAPVRLSARSSNATDVPPGEAEAAPAATATTTVVRKPTSKPQKRKPKGSRPTGKRKR